MGPESIISVAQTALELILLLVAIVLLPALFVGLLVSMFQAATQINEMTLSFIPKLMVTLVTLMVAGPWMLRILVNYAQRLIENIPFMIG